MKRNLNLGTPNPGARNRDPGDQDLAATLFKRTPLWPWFGRDPHAGRESEHRVGKFTIGAVSKLTGWPVAIAVCACLTGCFGFLKPASPIARHFVLTPLPAAESVTVTPGALSVGLGPVKLPAYLFTTSLAVRKGTNEIDYLPWTLWAERLDKGLQRALGANLATLLPTDQIRLGAWRSDAVALEVYVSIGQFDVDAGGRGVIVAWWRLLSPGGEKTLKSGESHFVRQGPSPDVDPSGAVTTLSGLVADFSRQLAQAIKETAPPGG